jgi:hypothetical protein
MICPSGSDFLKNCLAFFMIAVQFFMFMGVDGEYNEFACWMW